MPTSTKHDNFLAEAINPHGRQRPLGYVDGFRFGFGFFIAGLLISLILAGLGWGLMAALHVH